jgi:hypothetical protein
MTKYRVPITQEEKDCLLLNIEDALACDGVLYYSFKYDNSHSTASSIEDIAKFLVDYVLEHKMFTRKRNEYIIDSDGSLKKDDR